MNVRSEVAKRLQTEMVRKGFLASTLAQEASVPQTTIDEYLRGAREISFTELRPICEALTLRLMWLLAPHYERPLLQYRVTSGQKRDRSRVGEIENVFLTIASLLPKTRDIPTTPLDDSYNDVPYLLAAVNKVVEFHRAEHPTVESIYTSIGLPVLPISAGKDSFDAFLMRTKHHAMVCVNVSQPINRIHFSLLHEIAHYLYHRNQEVPIDFLRNDLYEQNIPDEAKPEFIANKFAQLYLVPFKEAERLASKWPALPNISLFLQEHRTSARVLAHAMRDIWTCRHTNKTPNFKVLADTIATSAGNAGCEDTRLTDFLVDQKNTLRSRLSENRDKFSDDVWELVWCGWDMDNA